MCVDTLNFDGRALETDWYPHSLDAKLPPTHEQGLLVPDVTAKWLVQRAVP